MTFKFYKPLFLSLTWLLLSACNSYSQSNFEYKIIPQTYLKANLPADILARAATSQKVAFDVTTLLPPDYVKDGTIDFTKYIQSAINKHAIVLMPDFPVLVSDSGLSLHNGQTLIFNTHSQVVLKPSALATYEILRIHNIENVSVYFPVIYGDKTTHTGTNGQWGMGIAIRASKNITIVNPRVYKCWGDGIYIGQLKNKTSKDISLYNFLLDDNRRNGISITSVNGLDINGGVVANSNGQMPQSGIDIEPNRITDDIDNIRINNVTTFNQPKYGIVISLQQLASRKVGSTSINITNHVDENSGNAFAIIGRPNTNTLNGEIRISSPVWIKNRLGAVKLPLRNYGLKLRIGKPKIVGIANDDTEMNKIKDAVKDKADIRIE